MPRYRIKPLMIQQSSGGKNLTHRLSPVERSLIGKNPTEEQEQEIVMEALKKLPYKGKTIFDYIHHSPNGGKRSKREGAEFKRQGTKSGFPDLMLPIAKQGFNGLYIEMKSLTGTTTLNQKEYMVMLQSENNRVEVCKGAKAAITVILDYMGIK